MSRPPTPCPRCVADGINPPEPRMKPGFPCRTHNNMYMRVYMQKKSGKFRRIRDLKEQRRKLVVQLIAWIKLGQEEDAKRMIIPDIERIDLALKEQESSTNPKDSVPESKDSGNHSELVRKVPTGLIGPPSDEDDDDNSADFVDPFELSDEEFQLMYGVRKEPKIE